MHYSHALFITVCHTGNNIENEECSNGKNGFAKITQTLVWQTLYAYARNDVVFKT